MLPSVQGQEHWKPGRDQSLDLEAAGIVVRFHQQSLGFLGTRYGLEGNPAFPKSASLQSHPTIFLMMSILFQSPGTLLGGVSGLGLIPVQNWARGLAGSARAQGRDTQELKWV